MLRGWKATLLATITIAVSLFVWGAFLLAGQNLGQALARWRSEARLIVYLVPDSSEQDRAALTTWIGDTPWVSSVRRVSADEAAVRFQEAFPSLEDLMDGWLDSPLPESLEVSIASSGVEEAEIRTWIEELETRGEVDMVDDDRDWIERLESIATMARTVGLVVGLVLLGAASFTIASVVRLNAYLYQDEIEIMRLVGATEFLIRGPFYCEGLLEGLIGGVLASAGLFAAHQAVLTSLATEGVLTDILLRQFLGWPQLALLILVGGLAGAAGAILSLRGESLLVEDV